MWILHFLKLLLDHQTHDWTEDWLGMLSLNLQKEDIHITGSCSSNGVANSTLLPTSNSWARCVVSGSLPQDTSSSCSNNLAKKNTEASNGPQALMPGVACTEMFILDTKESGEDENSTDVHSDSVVVPSALNKYHIGGNSQTSAFVGLDQDKVAPSTSTSFLETGRPKNFNTNKEVSNRDVHGLSSVSINSNLKDSYFTHSSRCNLKQSKQIQSNKEKESQNMCKS